MGLGSTEVQRRTYYLSPRSLDKDKKVNPHFVVKVRENGSYRDLPSETSVSGYLVGIGTGEYEFPKGSGDMNTTIKIFLVDGEDLFKIEANIQSNMVRNLMNSILGTPEINVLRISLAVKNDFPNIYVNNDGGKTNWKFQHDKDLAPLIQEVPDPKKPGKSVKVYHKVDELLFSEWKKLIPVIEKRAKEKGWLTAAPAPTPADDHNNQSETPSLQQEFDNTPSPEMMGGAVDDLPF